MDEHPLFRPRLSTRSELPWYNRHILEGMTQFGPGQLDSFTVFVTPEAVIDLHEGTRQQAPNEAFGLLMGKVYEDEIGSFTVVARAIYAHKLQAGFDYVQLSHEEVHKLRFVANRTYPALDFVGWTHSHRCVSGYSEVDYQEQKTWNEDYHIGILTFIDSIIGINDVPWAVAYRGPLAQLLPLVYQGGQEVDRR